MEHYVRRNGKHVSPCVECCRSRAAVSQARRDAVARYNNSEARRFAGQRYNRTDNRRESDRRMRKRYPEKFQARDAVAKAIRRGRLLRSDMCEDCKQPSDAMRDGRSGLWAHHHNGYAKEHALDVVWLCHPCHQKADA